MNSHDARWKKATSVERLMFGFFPLWIMQGMQWVLNSYACAPCINGGKQPGSVRQRMLDAQLLCLCLCSKWRKATRQCKTTSYAGGSFTAYTSEQRRRPTLRLSTCSRSPTSHHFFQRHPQAEQKAAPGEIDTGCHPP